MILGKFGKLSAAIALFTLLGGCAGTVVSPVKEQDKSTSGEFDGVWKVEVAKGAGTQYVDKWTLTCGDMSRVFELVVRDGVINIASGQNKQTAYVSKTGKFKVILPIAGETKESVSSSTSVANGRMQLILRGQLAEQNAVGFFTVGVAEFGYGGCTAKTRFLLLGEPDVSQET